MSGNMELRHLRYFVAVADAGSVTVAAARKLHTSQPSLSRQIRDLEAEVGTQLLTRGARGNQTNTRRSSLSRSCALNPVAGGHGSRCRARDRLSSKATVHHGF